VIPPCYPAVLAHDSGVVDTIGALPFGGRRWLAEVDREVVRDALWAS
jgi:hypothetical protein